MYATANGPSEVDGPKIGAETNFYTTNWDVPNLYNYESYEVDHSGSNIFSGSIYVGNQGPGTIVALGEVNDSSLQMEGYFHGLQHMWSAGGWYDWPGLTPCQDSPYTVYQYGSTYVHDKGNL